jgi:hypothetical protein
MPKLPVSTLNSAFTKTEAIESGYDESIVLNEWGRVAEGSGENIFLVIDGKLVTPSASESILIGITRNSIIELAQQELGLEVIERPVERGELYTCAEAFYTGTAANVAPIAEIDHRKVGDGEIGPGTQKLSDLYTDVILGNNPKYMHWEYTGLLNWTYRQLAFSLTPLHQMLQPRMASFQPDNLRHCHCWSTAKNLVGLGRFSILNY